MVILVLTGFLALLLLILAIVYNTTGLWIISLSTFGLLLLYFVIKEAVKAAFREYDLEKECKCGSNEH